MRSSDAIDAYDEKGPRVVYMTRVHRNLIDALAGQDDELEARRCNIVQRSAEYQRLIRSDVDPRDALKCAAATVQQTRRPWWDAHRLRRIQRERDAILARAWAILNRPTRDV